jgi:multidrug efflux pump subunit AcrB
MAVGVGDPTFTVKVLTVTALWPGATTTELQDQVTDRLEKRLQELAYYDRTETAVRPSLMLIKLYLKDSMPPSAVPEQFYQARKKLYDETAYLPRGVIGPLVNDEYSDVYFALYALQAPGMPHRELVLQGEDLRQRLLRVPGVEKINILGEQPQKNLRRGVISAARDLRLRAVAPYSRDYSGPLRVRALHR